MRAPREREGESLGCVCIPVDTLGDLASCSTVVLVGQRVDVSSKRSGRGGVDAGDMVVNADLCRVKCQRLQILGN